MSRPRRPGTHRTGHRRPVAMRRPTGFTLVELLIALAVAGILAVVAYPSYSAQMAKGRRADGKQALLEAAQLLERHYAERGTYLGATLGSGGLYPTDSRAGHYRLALAEPSADGFTLTATPVGVQADDRCGRFTLNHLGTVTVSGSVPLSSCW